MKRRYDTWKKKEISGSIWENKKKKLQNSFPIFRNFSISINTFDATHQKKYLFNIKFFSIFPPHRNTLYIFLFYSEIFENSIWTTFIRNPSSILSRFHIFFCSKIKSKYECFKLNVIKILKKERISQSEWILQFMNLNPSITSNFAHPLPPPPPPPFFSLSSSILPATTIVANARSQPMQGFYWNIAATCLLYKYITGFLRVNWMSRNRGIDHQPTKSISPDLFREFSSKLKFRLFALVLRVMFTRTYCFIFVCEIKFQILDLPNSVNSANSLCRSVH